MQPLDSKNREAGDATIEKPEAIEKPETPEKPEAPVIISHPMNTDATPGGSASFAVEAAGDSADLSYMWFYTTVDDATNIHIKDNIVFNRSDTAMLRLNNVPESYNGYRFFCQVKSSYGDTLSNWAFLTVAPGEPQTHEVNNKDGFLRAIGGASYGDTVRLTTHISFADSFVYISTNVIIDLNGYNLTVKGINATALQVNFGYTLILKGPGVFTADGTGIYAGVINNNSTVELTGGAVLNAVGGSFGVSSVRDAKTAVTDVIGNNGVIASAGGEITVTGNVRATGDSGVGAFAQDGGKIQIDGAITASDGAAYVKVGYINKTWDQHEPASSKPGYLEYTDGDSYVWVKETATDAGLILLSPTLATRVAPGGSTSFSVRDAENLKALEYLWFYTTADDPYNIRLSDNEIFSGTCTDTLTLRGIPLSYDGYRFICLVRYAGGDIYSNWMDLAVTPA